LIKCRTWERNVDVNIKYLESYLPSRPGLNFWATTSWSGFLKPEHHRSSNVGPDARAQDEAPAEVGSTVVRIALQKIDQDRISDALKSLPLHAKLVLVATVRNNLENKSSGSIYENYFNLCKRSGIEPLTTRRVSGLVTDLDTLGLVSATLVNYGRYGRTKKIIPQISQDVLKQAFQEDGSVNQLFNN
jgi:hypothetical protein